MKVIIAATDFSPASLNAVNFAAGMAVSIKAELVLLNVYTLPVIYSDGPIITIPIEELKEGSERGLAKLKNDIFRRTSGKILVDTKSRMGNVTEELKEICNSLSPFAVVIGTRGKTKFEKAVFGSSAMSIIKHLKFPVLCVPPSREYGSGIKNIGFACDFKEVAATVPYQSIKQFVGQFQATFHILNVDHKGRNLERAAPEDNFSIHQMFLQERPEYHFISSSDIEKGIDEFVEKNEMDILIVIPKKHNLFRKIFKPGNTKQLVEESRVPLLCIHS